MWGVTFVDSKEAHRKLDLLLRKTKTTFTICFIKDFQFHDYNIDVYDCLFMKVIDTDANHL
jgi:hypothetical protein